MTGGSQEWEKIDTGEGGGKNTRREGRIREGKLRIGQTDGDFKRFLPSGTSLRVF